MSLIKDIKDAINMDFSHEAEIVIFNSERLEKILISSKNIKRSDRNILIDAINILAMGYKYKKGEQL